MSAVFRTQRPRQIAALNAFPTPSNNPIAINGAVRDRKYGGYLFPVLERMG
jgi:hypothetical protein